MKGYENREKEQEVKEIPSILAKRKLLPGDRVLWVIVAMFFAISMVVVYSATSQLGFRDAGHGWLAVEYGGRYGFAAGQYVK